MILFLVSNKSLTKLKEFFMFAGCWHLNKDFGIEV